jgi:hypothetical protein
MVLPWIQWATEGRGRDRHEIGDLERMRAEIRAALEKCACDLERIEVLILIAQLRERGRHEAN